MFSVLKNGFLGLSLAAGLLLVGCAANDTPGPSAAMAPDPQAVMCSTCQVVYINVPTHTGPGGKSIVGYHKQGVMECPYCKDAVANFFATGKLEANCPKCGGTMVICEQHGE